MPDKYRMTWRQVFDKLAEIVPSGAVVYGVPRGGMIAAGFVSHAAITHDPNKATVILDDIVDSGRTRDEYATKYPGLPFVALVEKTGEDSGFGWVVFPWERETGPEDAVVRILEYIGEDPRREGIVETPGRVVRSWDELYRGYHQDPAEILSKVFQTSDYDELIILKDIDFFSMCEHHILPFFGKAKVGYIPNQTGKIVGISKLARLVECFARRLQIQERMTCQIANALQQAINPIGVGVVIEAQHLCMKARGVAKPNSVMITSCLLGAIREKPEARQEFLSR